jgi:NAD-dependent DNA ligase
MATPTNIIHTIVLFYSDITYNRYVRDSARQQLALTVYHVMFNKFYHALPDEKVMAYTYLHLNRNWAIIKAEDMMTWISDMVDSAYGFYKTQLTINTSAHTIIKFLNRLRAAGVSFEDVTAEETSDDRFAGKVFVLTGTLEKYKRSEAAKLIEERGGKNSSSVSKNTDYVLAGAEAGSKLTKAEALGVKIISESDFEEMLV